MLGVVYWRPLKPALAKMKAGEPSVGRYGADEATPRLWEALVKMVFNLLCYI